MNIEGALFGERVLVVSDHGEWGGTRTYVEQLLGLLRTAGADVILASVQDPPDEPMKQLADELDVELIPYRDLVQRSAPLARAGGIVGRMRELASIRSEQHGVRDFARTRSVTSIIASAGRPGALLGAVRGGARSSYVMHTYPHGWKNVLLGAVVYGRILPRTTTVITVSDFAKRRIIRTWGLGRTADRVYRVYSTAGPVVPRARQHQVPVQILTVGAVEAYKDPFAWIAMGAELARRLPPGAVQFTWIGDGALLGACRDRASSLAGVADIRFSGASADVAEDYETADIYVQGSRVESLGLAVLDAARRGIPCVVTRTGGLPEVVCDGDGGFVVESLTNEDALDHLTSLSRQPELRDLIGAAALTHYAQRFSPESWVEGFLSILTGTERPRSNPSAREPNRG